MWKTVRSKKEKSFLKVNNRGCFYAAFLCAAISLAVFFAAGTTAVHADTAELSYEQGDVLELRTENWSCEYIILNPSKTNTNKPGTFLIQKDVKETVAFNYDLQGDDYLNVANHWEGSLAQTWCSMYYRRLPQPVKDAVIGVRTVETESGSDWAGVSNIDGTRTSNTDYEKDRVFFLSFIEYDTYKSLLADEGIGKWHLRAPYDCGDLAVYVCVVDGATGRVMNYGYTDKIGARPAFNLDLSKLPEGAECKHGNKILRVLDAEDTDAGYKDVEYKWSSDNSKCTASGICKLCGEEVSETAKASAKVTKKATVTSDGKRTYTASFKDGGFEAQSKSVKFAMKTVSDKKLPKIAVSKTAAAKSAFTVKWKKLSKKNQKAVNGIEIQYARDKSFKKELVRKAVRKNRVSYKASKLKSKTTYYVRLRTYRKVGGDKRVGKWSSVKKIRTK